VGPPGARCMPGVCSPQGKAAGDNAYARQMRGGVDKPDAAANGCTGYAHLVSHNAPFVRL